MSCDIDPWDINVPKTDEELEALLSEAKKIESELLEKLGDN